MLIVKALQWRHFVGFLQFSARRWCRAHTLCQDQKWHHLQRSSEWPVARKPTTEMVTAKADTSRLPNETNKLFSPACCVSFQQCQNPPAPCRGLAAQAHTSAMSACLHGVSSVLTSWESSHGFSGSPHCAPKWHKGPFMPESGSIHGHWVIAGRIHDCSASSISEVHWRKWRHRQLF